MSRADRTGGQPRAMIHRRILDVASSNPEASLSAIADDVSGASPDLVERVLDEYGDPGSEPDTEAEAEAEADQSMDTTNAAEDATGTASPDGGTATQGASTDDPPAHSFSEKQRRTLRALYERPEASQGDLAEELDVTRATVSRRLNAIPGFEWSDRRAFAESVFDGDGGAETESTAGTATEPTNESESESETTPETEDAALESSPDGDEAAEPNEAGSTAEPDTVDQAALEGVESAVATLDERLTTIESRVSGDADETAESAGSDEADAPTASLPPALAHKVVHACMESDRLTEDEELDVLRALMRTDD